MNIYLVYKNYLYAFINFYYFEFKLFQTLISFILAMPHKLIFSRFLFKNHFFIHILMLYKYLTYNNNNS